MAKKTKGYGPVAEAAQAQGWRVTDKGSKIMFFSPDGETIVTVHGTESCHRAMKNTLARLQRGGLNVAALK